MVSRFVRRFVSDHYVSVNLWQTSVLNFNLMVQQLFMWGKSDVMRRLSSAALRVVRILFLFRIKNPSRQAKFSLDCCDVMLMIGFEMMYWFG